MMMWYTDANTKNTFGYSVHLIACSYTVAKHPSRADDIAYNIVVYSLMG